MCPESLLIFFFISQIPAGRIRVNEVLLCLTLECRQTLSPLVVTRMFSHWSPLPLKLRIYSSTYIGKMSHGPDIRTPICSMVQVAEHLESEGYVITRHNLYTLVTSFTAFCTIVIIFLIIHNYLSISVFLTKSKLQKFGNVYVFLLDLRKAHCLSDYKVL